MIMPYKTESYMCAICGKVHDTWELAHACEKSHDEPCNWTLKSDDKQKEDKHER